MLGFVEFVLSSLDVKILKEFSFSILLSGLSSLVRKTLVDLYKDVSHLYSSNVVRKVIKVWFWFAFLVDFKVFSDWERCSS